MNLDGVILGCGNPLLDISAQNTSSLLEEYDLQLNNAILAEEKHMPIYDQLVNNYEVEYIAGGATQNSIRVAQWFLQHEGATSYIGSVGNDEMADRLGKAAAGDGVNVLYHVDKDTPTGTCAVLVQDKERSLVANLGAANKYDISHLQSDAIQDVLRAAQITYISGFFITVSPPSIQLIAEHCAENDKYFALNLAAPFIPQFFKDPLLAALEFANIVIANESEAAAFGTAMEYDDNSPRSVAEKLATYENRSSKPRIAIVTQGSGSTIIAHDGQIYEVDVPAIPAESIVDVNGAGDAFVGGLLAALAQGRDLLKCVEVGHYCASVILGRSGTSLDGLSPEKIE